MKKIIFFLPTNGHQLVGFIKGVICTLAVIFLSRILPYQDNIIIIGLLIFPLPSYLFIVLPIYFNLSQGLALVYGFVGKIHDGIVTLFTMLNIFYMFIPNIYANQFFNDLIMVCASSFILIFYYHFQSFISRIWITNSEDER